MPPIKLSLTGPGDGEDERVLETIELDEDLFGKLREAVDNDPDLTLGEALRQGIQHVVDNRQGPAAG
jgi:hypothetical protein